MPPGKPRYAEPTRPPTMAAIAAMATNVTYHGDSAIRSCIGLSNQSVNFSWTAPVRSATLPTQSLAELVDRRDRCADVPVSGQS